MGSGSFMCDGDGNWYESAVPKQSVTSWDVCVCVCVRAHAHRCVFTMYVVLGPLHLILSDFFSVQYFLCHCIKIFI